MEKSRSRILVFAVIALFVVAVVLVLRFTLFAPWGPPKCAHTPCSPGGALDSTCDTCVQQVCSADASCCNSNWTATCSQSYQQCGRRCDCTQLRVEGVPFDRLACDDCTKRVCSTKQSCCSSRWDADCVAAVSSAGAGICPW